MKATLIFVFLILLNAVLYFTQPVTCHAQEPMMAFVIVPTVRAQVELNHAKICANETGLPISQPDCETIWAVTRRIAGSGDWEDLLRAQQALSGRVTGLKPPSRHGNDRWTRHLRNSNEEPRGWPERFGPWERFAPAWARAREAARLIVGARRTRRSCRQPVMAWGCDPSRYRPCSRDVEMAAARGLVRDITCQTENWFYYRP